MASRSGYAMDIMPGNQGLSMPGTPLLPAEKRKRPSLKEIQQKYSRPRKVETLNAEELMARLRGTTKAPVEEAASAAQLIQNRAAAGMTRTSDIDAEDWGEVESSPGDMDGFDPVPETPETPPAPAPVKRAQVREQARTPVQPAPANHPADAYVARRNRLTMELADSTVTLSIVDLIATRYGVTILLPHTDGGAIVIPKPGSKVTLEYGNVTYDLYFPGTYFEMPELRITGMSFIRDLGEGDAHDDKAERG